MVKDGSKRKCIHKFWYICSFFYCEHGWTTNKFIRYSIFGHLLRTMYAEMKLYFLSFPLFECALGLSNHNSVMDQTFPLISRIPLNLCCSSFFAFWAGDMLSLSSYNNTPFFFFDVSFPNSAFLGGALLNAISSSVCSCWENMKDITVFFTSTNLVKRKRKKRHIPLHTPSLLWKIWMNRANEEEFNLMQSNRQFSFLPMLILHNL